MQAATGMSLDWRAILSKRNAKKNQGTWKPLAPTRPAMSDKDDRSTSRVPTRTNRNRTTVTRLKIATAASLVAGGTALIESDASAAPKKKRPPFIDAHSHIWTRDIKSYPLRKTATLKDLNPPSFTTEELLATCQPQGVWPSCVDCPQCVLRHGQHIYDRRGEAASRRLSRGGNG